MSEPNQRRRLMRFVRNLDDAQVEEAMGDTFEYQVIADAHITGEFKDGPYDFMLWEYNALDQEGRERWLCLRIRYAKGPEDALTPEQRARRNGYYHEGGIPGEIVTLANLFLRRRFQLGPVVRWNDNPVMYHDRFWISQNQIDHSLVVGTSDLADLNQWFLLVEQLKPRLHQPFIFAARLYQQALAAVEKTPDIAYLNLVSAIEVLCHDFPIPEPSLEEINPELATAINDVSDEILQLRLRNAALKRERLIARRFTAFILSHLDSSFWEAEGRPADGAIAVDELPNFLELIYKQRSATLHSGHPFPPYIFAPPFNGEEKPTFKAQFSGERSWESGALIPYPHFFERLVRHVLLNYLQRNQEGGNAVAEE